METAAAAFLRAATAATNRSRCFLGNTPDHPVNFFGALKAGARIVHLSPLDGEIALSHKLSDSGARVLVTSNLSAFFADRTEIPRQGPARQIDRLRGRRLGQGRTPQTPLPQISRDHHVQAVYRRREKTFRLAEDRNR